MDSSPAIDFRAVWDADLRNEPLVQHWLWTGYLGPGIVTLLTSRAKCGKTTLLAALLARLRTGGTVAGQEVTTGKALVVSEEDERRWHARARRFDFRRQVCFVCRPFRSKPTPQQWQTLLNRILEMHREHHFALIVFDTLTELLPRKCENDAGLMIDALLPLRALTAEGAAVLLAAHASKKETGEGQWARGTVALPDHANISLELRYCRRPSAGDRRRQLTAQSHYDETPRQRIIELDEAGTSFVSRGDFAEEQFKRHWDELAAVLAAATGPLTWRHILADWPEQAPRPPRASLLRWLARAVRDGRLLCAGNGRRNDPYRYWLPGQEEKWAAAARAQEEQDKYAPLHAIMGPDWVERHVAALERELHGKGGTAAEAPGF